MSQSHSLYFLVCCWLGLLTLVRVTKSPLAHRTLENPGSLTDGKQHSRHGPQGSCPQLLVLLTLNLYLKARLPDLQPGRAVPLCLSATISSGNDGFCVPSRQGASLAQTRGLVHAG